ncbi:protein FANTASTIC FOUR 3-like [Rhododendron vialii]|uniref:protein FANTASTIC FOUR 3-like n=1 Tax=Rhododendron vialii TaxID=182163 RepID=UPI00265FB801|nr:protein FANTASTIC FOUR 3-like [Rhododendron vialii]
MTSIVCQGLQSCLEPRLIEPRTLRPKLAPPKSNSRQENRQNHEEENDNKKNGESGGWSFIKALTNTPQNPKQVTETEKVYIHPLAKRSSSALSKKSLEMCTEGLGSETGSDISESSDELSLNMAKSYPIPPSKSRELGRKLSQGGGNFPPPLTSISGSDGVRVRPHREGGRLVIEAATVTSCNGYFQAERGDGRLRLRLLKDSTGNCHNEEVYDDDDDNGDDDDNDDGDDEGEEGDYDDDKWDEGMGGDNGNVEGEIANIVELPCCRPSRCKESGGGNNNKGMSIWGQFWVAIS